MAPEVNPFGAHVCGTSFPSQSQKFGNSTPELLGHHMVGVVAKTHVAQGYIRRIVANPVPPPSQRFEPDVANAFVGQGLVQCLAIEMGQAPRHRNRANVDENLN